MTHFGGKSNCARPQNEAQKESSQFGESRCKLGFKVVSFFVFVAFHYF
jgi:hypothetical protein